MIQKEERKTVPDKKKIIYQPLEDMKSGPLLNTCQITQVRQLEKHIHLWKEKSTSIFKANVKGQNNIKLYLQRAS